MPKARCPRHGADHPCTCAMGNIYRFIEPVLLLILKEKGRSYGYELSESLGEHALTDAEIERAAMYRTLRTLEGNGYVTSSWEPEHSVRRVECILSRDQVTHTCGSGLKSWRGWGMR